MSNYVHGYSGRESERLFDQASTLEYLLHHDTIYPRGARILEAGCGVGAQTTILAKNSPEAKIVSIDISGPSLDQARRRIEGQGIGNVQFQRADISHLPFGQECFDHVFLCFVLEHLAEPVRAVQKLKEVLRPGGSLTVIEGDHGSCYFHPQTPAATAAWRSLIRVQACLGGDSLIGRRLYPLLQDAGFDKIVVSPRMVYSDASRKEMRDGFVERTIIPMVEGVEKQALQMGLVDAATWKKGIADLHRTASQEGTFCYSFFKGVAIK